MNWISVNDELPAVTKDVLVLDNMGCSSVAYWHLVKHKWYAMCCGDAVIDYDRNIVEIEYVTHWCDIPDDPDA